MNVPAHAHMEMWFDFASPYSYLALSRLDALAQEAGVQVALRPFLLGPIFQTQGWKDSPFRLFPGKGAYMMRDIARLAEKYGIDYKPPQVFPRVGVLPARVALLGQDQPCGVQHFAWKCSVLTLYGIRTFRTRTLRAPFCKVCNWMPIP